VALQTTLRDTREAIVLAHMTAENDHDFDRCIAVFDHPRYEIVPTGEIYDGGDEVGTLLDENERGFSDFHFDIEAMHHADDALLVEGRFRGTHDGNWHGLPGTGREVDVPMIIVFRFEEDRMVCERTYFDIGTPLRQLGVARDPNSTGGRIATMLNHPINVSRAFLRQLRPRR
jgi:steroid delta-isomerase-like uncharacterized protein